MAASGVESIHLIDFDTVDLSNLHRQTYFKTTDIGLPKAQVLAQYITHINPWVNISYQTTAIDIQNIRHIIRPYDIVVDCTDHLTSKYLINDICVILGKPLVYGSLHKFDGYVASFNLLEENQSYSANLRDAFPKIPKKRLPNCSEVGTLNPIVGLIGMLQANEVIKLAAGIGKPLKNALLIYNTQDNSQMTVKLSAKTDKAKIQKIFDKENYTTINCSTQNTNLLITVNELKQQLETNINHIQIISMIDDINYPLPFRVDFKTSLNQIQEKPPKLDPNKTTVIVCLRGISSYKATQFLLNTHPNQKILSLKNGISNY